MEINNILVTLPLDAGQKARLEAAAPGAAFTYDENDDPRELKKADMVIGNLPVERLAGAKALKWLQIANAGVEQYCEPGVLPDGVILSNATGAYGLPVAEHMFAMHLSLLKKLHLYRDNQSNCNWRDEGPVGTIAGSRILVLGLGDIGSSFARMEKALGAHVTGVCRTLREKPVFVDELHSIETLDELLPTADLVMCVLPNTKRTMGIMSRERISLMKKGAILLNAGRGNAVDTQALCDALESGQLGGAGLDVTDPEPLPVEHRLWKISNAIITPHISGGFSVRQTLDKIVDIAAGNLVKVLRGGQPETLVDLEAGYTVKR